MGFLHVSSLLLDEIRNSWRLHAFHPSLSNAKPNRNLKEDRLPKQPVVALAFCSDPALRASHSIEHREAASSLGFAFRRTPGLDDV
jgi:hypothetical protein